MLLCLTELLENDNEMYDVDGSSDWISVMDRGGLNHVSNTMFLLLLAMEMEVKTHIAKLPDDSNIHKDLLKEKLLSNEEVDFHWESLSVNWVEGVSTSLLSYIIEYYLTVRGFAYVSNWMEKYKKKTKKDVQKSKGIRKTLLGTTSTDSSEDHD